MKAAYEAIKTSVHDSFIVRRFSEQRFAAPYHYHPEYELTLIVQGSGKRYIGTHMEDFSAGDLVLLGANVPHCWKSSEAVKGPSSSVVVHFRENFLGPAFFLIPEMRATLQLLKESVKGLHFKNPSTAIQKDMEQLLSEANRQKKLMLLLALLHQLATQVPYELLQKKNELPALTSSDNLRVQKVLGYIIDHFKQGISLKAAAAAANLSVPAFCKYFKRITRKTFIDAVNDYRIDFAVHELINTDHTVSQIGYNSGFNDLSNFYKTFRTKMKTSPLQYRATFNSKLKDESVAIET